MIALMESVYGQPTLCCPRCEGLPSEVLAVAKRIYGVHVETATRTAASELAQHLTERPWGADVDLPHLTPTERRLLVALYIHRGQVLHRSALWMASGSLDPFDVHSRGIDVQIRRLRVKLGAAWQIETEHGVGYSLKNWPGGR